MSEKQWKTVASGPPPSEWLVWLEDMPVGEAVTVRGFIPIQAAIAGAELLDDPFDVMACTSDFKVFVRQPGEQKIHAFSCHATVEYHATPLEESC